MRPISTKTKFILVSIVIGLLLFCVSVTAAVRAAYTNVGSSDPFSFSTYKRIDAETMDLEGSGIDNLSGIERCEDLRELSVAGCGITDFEPLYGMTGLEVLDLAGCDISCEQYDKLHEALPGCKIIWDVPFGGRRIRYDSITEVDLGQVDPSEYGKLKYFPNLTSLDLQNAEFTPELVDSINNSPDLETSWNVELFGKTYDGKETFVDLNEIEVDMDTLVAGLQRLPYVRQVELCGSGLSNEQMEQLIEMFPKTKFVWRIKMSKWELRTDVTNFSTGHVGFSMKYIANEEAQQLKYCKDLVALDIGHQSISDLSFLYELKKLRTLILVDLNPRVVDITPIGSLENLEYLELFENDIHDISPLANCKHLKEINFVQNWIEDWTPLYGHDELVRVWLSADLTSKAQRAELKKNLPKNCECRFIYRYGYPCAYWRPIDYRKWGFKYDNPLNKGMIARMDGEAPGNLSHANIDPDAYGDEVYDTVSGSDVASGSDAGA